MIYRSGINCGYLRLPEVVTLYTRVEREERPRGEDWKNQVEFIVAIDVDGACTHTVHIHRKGRGRFINF